MGIQKFDKLKWIDVCADKDNAWQIVLLRDPLMLPRPAAIT
jgi:hypothetical protein